MAGKWSMAVRLIPLLTLTLSVLHSTDSQAQQQGFFREGANLHYVWQYENASTQAFALILPEDTALPPWTAWRSAQADAFVFQQLMRDAKEQFPDVNFQYRKTANGGTIDYIATQRELIPQVDSWLTQQRATLFDAYLDQHYYKRHGSDSNMIRPDHVRIATDSSPELLETAQALQRMIISSATEEQKQRYQNDEKSLVVAGLLNFVQSIPYDPLETLNGLRGVGFLMPEQVLAQNRGDCDSKSALMMSLLMALYPDLPQAVVYVPNHALLAIKLSRSLGDEETINIDGQPFIPLEVTGPAEIPPGLTGAKSKEFIQSNQYQYDQIQLTVTNSTPN
jgi:hypothetical protein